MDVSGIDDMVSRLAIAGSDYADMAAAVAREEFRGMHGSPDYSGLQAKREAFATCVVEVHRHAREQNEWRSRVVTEAVQACLTRINTTAACDGETLEQFRAAVVGRVADLMKPTGGLLS